MTKLISLSALFLVVSFTYPTQADTIDALLGTWVAEDSQAVIQTATFYDEASSPWAKGSVLLEGDCWQCKGDLQSVFYMYAGIFSVLPVASNGDQAEYVEFTQPEPGMLLAKVTYRQKPEICRPPFNCLWKEVGKVEVSFSRD